MKISKKLVCLITLLLSFSITFSQTELSGIIPISTTWTASLSPYSIVGDVQIPDGVVLTIEPGVEIRYAGAYEILVQGSIIANGTVDDKIVFTSSNPGVSLGARQLKFDNAQLDNSNLSYVRMEFADKAIQIGKQTGHEHSGGFCEGSLIVSNTIIESAMVITYRDVIEANLVFQNANISNSSIHAVSYSSNKITFQNTEISNCEIISDSNRGITLEICNVTNGQFTLGGEGKNFIITETIIEESGFNTSGYWGNIVIDNSQLKNTPINHPWSETGLTILNSTFLYDGDFGIKCRKFTMDNTSVTGNANGTAIEIVNGESHIPNTINNSTIKSNKVAIKLNQNGPLNAQNNKIFDNNTFNIENLTTKNLIATNNWWGTIDVKEIRDKIFDYDDDINYGIVTYSPLLLSETGPSNYVPELNVTVNPLLGHAPLTVTFTASANDPDGSIVLYEWDFNGDGTYDWNSTENGNTVHVYSGSGEYSARCRIIDDSGLTNRNDISINVIEPGDPVEISGIIPLSTTWTASLSPYSIVGDVQIPDGVVLTIEPGVEIRYAGAYEILVQGSIIANGTVDDKIVFTSSNPGVSLGARQLKFDNAQLDNSNLSYVRMEFADKAIQIGKQTGHEHSGGFCEGSLIVSNTIIESAMVITYRDVIEANLVFQNANISNSSIHAVSYSSNKITFQNTEISNCEIISDSNRGITLEICNVTNGQFTLGGEGKNFIITETIIEESGFNTSGYWGNIVIDNSQLKNTPINHPWSETGLTILNSTFLYDGDFGIKCRKFTMDNTSVTGNANGTAIEIVNGESHIPNTINNSTIKSNKVAIKLNQNGPLNAQNNKIFDNNTFNIENLTTKNLIATNNWWGTIDVKEIRDKIFDYDDDINYGIVTYSPLLLSETGPSNYVPELNVTVNPLLGHAPLTVTFTASANDPDGSIVLYEWDFDGDGTYDWNSTINGNTENIYGRLGNYMTRFRVTDNIGLANSKDINITVLENVLLKADSLALVAFYNSTDGPNWTNNSGWLVEPLENWFGVSVENGRVTRLDLRISDEENNNINGTIPPEIGNLSKLTHLNLSGAWDNPNNLIGSIPPDLGNLENLEFLNIGFNKLTGEIPAELGNLNNLYYLNLQFNQLHGSLPVDLGNLNNLKYLWIDGNTFNGSIPSVFGSLSNLMELGLGNNQLTGNIPSELGNLNNLTDLTLYANQITGSIPSELGNLSNLKRLWLHDNQLTGSIPSELGNASKLEHLELGNNQLTSLIPIEIISLDKLKILNLNHNQLTGEILPDIGNIVNLESLDLRNNQLNGSIPSSLGNLSNLIRLDLGNNQLTGSIPPELGNLINLTFLRLSYNQISGIFPLELCNLNNLYYISLWDNQLSGDIPSEVSNLVNLELIYLGFNKFSSLPNLSSLSKIYRLWIEENKLDFGAIEPNIGVASETFTYSPQDKIGEIQDLSLFIGDQHSLAVEVGGVNNQYQWYRNGAVISDENKSDYTINSASFEDIAQYTCEMTNTVVTDLTLFSHPITIDVQIDPTKFEFDGEIVAEVLIDDIPITEGGILAAFVGDECRALRNGGRTGPAGKYVFVLRCYSNEASGETISFKFTDPAYPEVSDVREELSFIPNMIIGNALEPFQMHAYTTINISIPLARGWTWFSLNVTNENMPIEDILTSLTPREDDYIKNQTVSATYYNQDGWIGELNEFNNVEMYKIKLDLPDQLEYKGFLVDVNRNPLIIESGWNWIAYTPQYNLMLSDALLSLNIRSFDYIKNQRSSSTYYDGYGWFGTLKELFPYEGYMIKLAEHGELTYPPEQEVIPVVRYHEITEITNENQFYKVQPSLYEFSGSVTAEVLLNGINTGSSENILYALAGNNCRGAARGLLFPPTGDYVYNIMIYSNSLLGEELTFRYYTSEEDQWYEFEEKLNFESDMIESDAFDPFELKNGTALNSDWLNNNNFNLETYPNPFRDILQINFSISAYLKVNITLYDNYGRIINIIENRAYQPGSYKIEWNSNNLPNGVYFVCLKAEGFVENKKIIKVK